METLHYLRKGQVALGLRNEAGNLVEMRLYENGIYRAIENDYAVILQDDEGVTTHIIVKEDEGNFYVMPDCDGLYDRLFAGLHPEVKDEPEVEDDPTDDDYLIVEARHGKKQRVLKECWYCPYFNLEDEDESTESWNDYYHCMYTGCDADAPCCDFDYEDDGDFVDDFDLNDEEDD